MPYPTPTSTANYLESGNAALTSSRYGKYSGADRYYDCGAGPALFDGVLIASFTSLDSTSGNEAYTLKVWGANATDFSGQVELMSVSLNALPTNNEQAYFISNKADDVVYRYLRLQLVLSGTTPSIDLDAWVLHLDDLDELTQAQLVKFMAVAATRFGDATEGFRAWAGGTATGGPNSDGEYPLYDGEGNTYLVPCPAKIALTAGLTWEAVDALSERSTAFADTDAGPNVIIDYASALKKGKLFLFAARRTQDLQPFVGFLTDELIPSWRDGGGGTGIERKIAVREIMRQTSGFVNPIEYGVKPDCLRARKQGSVTNGSNVLNITEDLFSTLHVGMSIAVGGAVSGGGTLRTTITGRNSATQITMATNATRTTSGQDVVWGTINTAAMQDALDACLMPGAYNYGKVLLVPTGATLTGSLVYRRRTAMFGHGLRQSELVRWDDSFYSSTYSQYITQYQDGTYYYSYFPFYDDPDSALPMYKPLPAPLLANAQGYAYNGVAGIARPSGSRPADIGFAVDADFCAFGDFGIDGQRFTCSRQMTCFEFRGAQTPIPPNTGSKVYWQVDPYFALTRMHLHDAGWYGAEIYKRASATIQNVELIANGAAGMLMDGYDCNLATLLAIENSGPGIIAGGTNSNWINLKISYNGNGGFEYLHGTLQGLSNLYLKGQGHNFQNCRIQESKSNSIFVEGPDNVLSGCNVDDTGCIVPAHDAFNVPVSDRPQYIIDNTTSFMPVVTLGPNADRTRFNDLGYGAQVHIDPAQNFATHAIFFLKSGSNMAQNCSGRIYSKFDPGDETWYTQPGGTGDYAPSDVGVEGGTLPSFANEGLTLKGLPLADYM